VLELSDIARLRGWRSECEIEGVEVEVTLHGARPVEEGNVGKCRAAFLSHSDIEAQLHELPDVDVIFTDSIRFVRFAGRSGPLHFIENVSEYHTPDDLDFIMQEKRELLSVLLPPVDLWDAKVETIYEQAQAHVPDHIYIDDGTLETHTAAFRPYRFSLIADPSNFTISLPFIRSLSFHTVAAFNGFVEVGAMVFNGIADFEAEPFNLHATLDTLRKHNDHMGALWHYQRILQDQLQYRYNRPFEERLLSQACTLCRLRVTASAEFPGVAASPPPLVFVGVYSARRNFDKRQAIRETWGRFLLEEYGFRCTFFLGEASLGASLDEMRMRREIEKHGDVVFLAASEGYRMNSRKGILFLEWIALRSEAEFLLKVDDDVYFRPAPLLRQLRNRPPAQYVWGHFDYISPLPTDERDNFYNTPEDFPFDVFAPYPRGVVRVMSMDIVRLLAQANRENKLRMIYGDDPCLGVHLRQLLFDPVEPLPSLTLDDFDNRVFAMEPSCHPNLWSKITNRTWAIHHVSPEQIFCMFRADVQAGYYSEMLDGIRHNDDILADGLPDLCACAADQSFVDRVDLDTIRTETDRILFDEDSTLDEP